MKSIEESVLSRIYGRGRGCTFSSADFIDEFEANNIDYNTRKNPKHFTLTAAYGIYKTLSMVQYKLYNL